MRNLNIVVMDGKGVVQDDLNWKAFENLGNLSVYDRTPSDKIIERAKDADVVLSNKVPFFDEQISLLKNLKYIGVLATGYNNVDLQAARARKIEVTNIPSYGSDSVAQAVFAHILNIAVQTEEHSQAVRSGAWTKCPDLCFCLKPQIEIANLKLGIFGYGEIGRRVAKIGKAFGMDVCAYSPSKKAGTSDNDVKFVSENEIFEISDVISLNCALNTQTEKIINSKTISKMKDGAWLINTGRGGLVDEEALAQALNSGKLGSAGLDVLSTEPPKANNPLLSAKNCHISPHNAWTTKSARMRLIDIAYKNLESWIEGKTKNSLI